MIIEELLFIIIKIRKIAAAGRRLDHAALAHPSHNLMSRFKPPRITIPFKLPLCQLNNHLCNAP